MGEGVSGAAAVLGIIPLQAGEENDETKCSHPGHVAGWTCRRQNNACLHWVPPSALLDTWLHCHLLRPDAQA